MLKLVRISDPEEICKKYPYQLSGGMLQRVLIAMALACRPKLLIADEPTSSLDVSVGAQILRLIGELKGRLGTSIVLITHDLGIVANYCDKVAIMYAGSAVEIGCVKEIFREPLHPYTRGLLGCMLTAETQKGNATTIPGTIPDLIDPPSGCRFYPRCAFADERCRSRKPSLLEVKDGHFVACYLY